MLCFSGRITAAAATGPARGPRPASSTPAVNLELFIRKLNCKDSVGKTNGTDLLNQKIIKFVLFPY